MSKKTSPISIRLTAGELASLDRVAKQRGLSRHDMIRQVLRAIGELDTCADILDIVCRFSASQKPRK